jgi:glycosyltransferase involved in cell wall biosynthesis
VVAGAIWITAMTTDALAKPTPVRVLHLRDSPWVDGPGRTILETGSHIDADRVEYYIGALVPMHKAEHPLIDAARARGLNIIEFRDSGGMGGPLVDEIVAAIDRHRIDVLHSSEFRTRMIVLLCRLRRRVRMITTAHGWIANSPKRKLIRFADKTLLRFSEQVILVSNAMRRLVPKWWLPEGRTQVLHNALVLSDYGRDVLAQERRPFDPMRVTLLNVGRLSPEKGQDMLLRAVHRLLPKWPGLRLRIAGIGPLENELRNLTRELQIENQVEFAGYITDMPPLYFDSDLVVQSSYTEGLPNVILEAAFLRVPVLATAVGGTDEVVSHGKSGWLIRPNLDEIVAGIERFLQHPTDFAQMAQCAHAHLIANFSFDARTERMMRIYESLVRRSA